MNSIFRIPFCGLLLFFWTAAANAQLTVLFLGDSLTSGYGIPKEAAYPAVVQQLAASDGMAIKIINGGLSGDTSAGALRRVSQYNNQQIDILFLAIGANDGLRGQDTKLLERNISNIITSFKEAHGQARVVIAGIKAPPNMGLEYTKAFDETYPRLAKQKQLTLMPFLLDQVAAEPKLNLSDRIHPNEMGHRLIAENVWRVLKPVVQEAMQTSPRG